MPRNDRINHTSPKKIERAERMDEALQWRIKGLNYRQIAEKMGMSESSVYNLVKDAIDKIPRQSREVVFHIELDALHNAARALDPLIEQGDIKAIEQRLKLHDRMLKLYHLDKHMGSQQDTGERVIEMMHDSVSKLYEMQQHNGSDGVGDARG